jgi:GNAT superfamily N-acetyltransferase
VVFRGASVTDIEFRAEDYTPARAGLPLFNARATAEELPEHPDLSAPCGSELEPGCRGIFVVGYVNGRPAASGGYREFPADPTAETVEFVRLHVRSTTRRTGLGRALLTELEERARDDKYRRAVLPLGADQRGAQVLFELLGYRRVPGEPDAWGRVRYGRELTDRLPRRPACDSL